VGIKGEADMKKILLTFIISLLPVGIVYAGIETVTLITEEEGAMKEAPPGLYEIGRALNDGPDIKIVSPEIADEYRPPVYINIIFITKDDAEVDLSKFKVEYLKILAINITNRFLQYTTKDGIKIEKADFPRGKHKLRLTIGDDKGGITQEIFVVKLK
jgi:hypothetical protein